MQTELVYHNRSGDELGSRSAVLTTKLYRPVVSSDLEPRSELVARLERNRQRALTVISAPTGYGKSTLASMWLSMSEAAGGWISLDAEDDDPELFLAYMVAAIRFVFPNLPLHVQALLGTGALPSPATIARTLLNDLDSMPRQLLLALDDLHVIRSQVIYDFLAELLRHPSPKLHLVLIGRRDPPLPLPSLRAHRLVTEIRARDLRFSSAETASLLTKILNHTVDVETASLWTERTEGWVTALSLAALALRQRDQDDIRPHDESIDSHHLQEYLLAEIMNSLDPLLREGLLITAWLDRFCPSLCTVLCQPDSSTAPANWTGEVFVRRLREDNLFLISLDSEARWFRLHHLFRDMLRAWGRNQFGEAEIAAIHRRAGAWFACHDLPDEAIRYLVLGGDYGAAEQVVRQYRYALMNSEQWPRLERWLRQFPAEVRETRATLAGADCVLAMHMGQYRMTISLARKAEALLATLPPGSANYNEVLGEVSAITAALALAEGNPDVLMSSAQRAVQLLPMDALLLRSLATGVIAGGMQMRGDYEDGRQFLVAALDEPQWTTMARIRLMDYLCILSFMQGDIATTQTWADRVRQLAKEHDLAESLCFARHYLGVVHYLRHEFDAAESFLRPLVEEPAGAAQSHMTMGAFALVLIYDSRGEFLQGNALMDRLVTDFQNAGDAFALAIIEAFSVELALRRGDAGAARRKRGGVNFALRPPLWFFYISQLTPIKLLLLEGTPDALGAARAALDEFDARMRVLHRNLARIDGLALSALVCDRLGDAAAAFAHLTTALALACDACVIRPFVDLGAPMARLLQRLCDSGRGDVQAFDAFITRLLGAFPVPAPSSIEQPRPDRFESQRVLAADTLPEPLTEREVQVLQQLATHLTPAEIAARYVVSVSTVRSQIKSIYRKLDVHNRKEAIRRSRALNII